jgi:hypothetical protein
MQKKNYIKNKFNDDDDAAAKALLLLLCHFCTKKINYNKH